MPLESVAQIGFRLRKAIALADLLDAAGIDPASVESMATPEWRMLATAARTRTPSQETRTLVLSMLRAREAARAQFAPNPATAA